VEICVEGVRHVFDYASLTGGHGHSVFPQHLLVRAWVDQLLEVGGRVLFSTEATAIDGNGAGRADEGDAGATVRAQSAQGPVEIRCGAVVLATGAGPALLPPGIESHEHTHPFRWLTTMLEAPPLGERTIYATHRNGFAAHLRRSAQLTRYYLQIPAGERLEDWADARVKAELELRLGVPPGTIEGPSLERDVLDLRVRVREPLQQGCVYLAGDAAHLITPAGGKGMNLAIQDGLELAEGLIEARAGHPRRLASYSATRLPAIWRAQELSNWMLSLFCGGVLNLHKSAPDPSASFAQRLHRAQVERLFTDPSFARWFARQYAGVDAAD
jgi:p-hydroxybenzoate 3-monooxygenase